MQDAFWPIQGLSCAGVTGSVGITRHARATQMAGLRPSQSHSMYMCTSLATGLTNFPVHIQQQLVGMGDVLRSDIDHTILSPVEQVLVTRIPQHIQSDIENCEGWLSPGGHSSGGRALTA